LGRLDLIMSLRFGSYLIYKVYSSQGKNKASDVVTTNTMSTST
jgi:hypothetical protein